MIVMAIFLFCFIVYGFAAVVVSMLVALLDDVAIDFV